MRCLCPHYQETDGGWCCLETLRQRDENAELKEALARANAEIKRLRAERTKAPLEGVFEEGTPSSQRLKETSPEERVARRGGARPGHEPHCRCAATEETADEVRETEAPAVCPHCHGALQEMPPRERTVVDLEEPRRREVVWRLGQRWCSHCRRVVRARPAGVLPKKSASNAALATLAVPAENNAAERAVRPLAVARKVSHGSQGEGGLRTREVLGSVLLTLRLRHGRDAWKVLVGALDKLAADPKTDIVRELFPEYDPDKEDSAKAARPA